MCVPLELIKLVSYPKEMVYRQRVEIEDPIGEYPQLKGMGGRRSWRKIIPILWCERKGCLGGGRPNSVQANRESLNCRDKGKALDWQ